MTETVPRYPLAWPDGWRRSTARRRAAFKTYKRQLSVMDGTSRVRYELERLGVAEGDFVISTNIQLRLDGYPRSDRGEPHDPGVAVYWQDRNDKRKVMALDLYDRVADNLAAVAATLEAMRAIERHGGAEILERTFTGFDALPPPRDPFRLLGLSAHHATEGSINAAFRSMAREAHPDAPTGSHNKMADLTWARETALKMVRERT